MRDQLLAIFTDKFNFTMVETSMGMGMGMVRIIAVGSKPVSIIDRPDNLTLTGFLPVSFNFLRKRQKRCDVQLTKQDSLDIGNKRRIRPVQIPPRTMS